MHEHKSDFEWIAIILAAGASSRMGQSKQLIKINGQTLIAKAVSTAREAGANEIIVVVGPDHELIDNELKNLSAHLTVNASPEKGMGASLKCGLNFMLSKFPWCNSAMILVCDQPLLNSTHLKRMVNERIKTKSPIVASFYEDRNGVPALFHKSIFDQLLKIDDQQGAKKVIEQNPTLVKSIDFPEGAVDLDTPEDWNTFKSQL